MITGNALISETLGQLGSEYVTSTDTKTGHYGIIQALEATVIATMTSGTFPYDSNAATNKVMYGTLTNVPLPAGISIYGYWTEVKLTSGKVILYNMKKPGT